MKRPEEYAGDKEEKDTDYSDGQEDCGQHRHLLYHSEKNLLGLVFTYEGTEFEIIQKMISTIACLLPVRIMPTLAGTRRLPRSTRMFLSELFWCYMVTLLKLLGKVALCAVLKNIADVANREICVQQQLTCSIKFYMLNIFRDRFPGFL